MTCNAITCIACILFIGVLLVVILVPMSFSYVERYEYGLPQRKSTGAVDTSTVYSRGRYHFGPDRTFVTYQADAHHKQLESLSVFSAGTSNSSVGLEFKINIDFTYMLKKNEIGLLHQEMASSYDTIIVSRAKDAIKNEAIYIAFTEYFQARKEVERRFKDAVQRRWNENPGLHCSLDQFHLGRIVIPESVARKQLESRVQNERNGMETFLQRAQVERELTAVEVNAIGLDTDKILRTAEAEASLVRAKATAEAGKLALEAQTDGTVLLFKAAGISTQENMIAFSYIRTLMDRGNVDLDLSYLAPDSILRTKSI